MSAQLLSKLQAELRQEELDQYQLFLLIERLMKAGPPTWENWLNAEIAYYDVHQHEVVMRNLGRAIREVQAAQDLVAA